MMITKNKQIKVGMVLFDTINTNNYKHISKVIVQSAPVSYETMCACEGRTSELKNMGMWILIRQEGHPIEWASCRDRGIDANHNNNRFFTTEEEADTHVFG